RDAHAGQRHEADGSPYIEHPLAVGQLLYLAGCREEVVAAGLLHDTVEHTDAGYDAETIFAADKVVSTQTLRRAIADQGEAQVRQRLTNPLEDKVEHYRNTLGLLD